MEAIAKHDFTATAEDELSFRRSQILKVGRSRGGSNLAPCPSPGHACLGRPTAKRVAAYRVASRRFEVVTRSPPLIPKLLSRLNAPHGEQCASTRSEFLLICIYELHYGCIHVYAHVYMRAHIYMHAHTVINIYIQ